MIIFGDFFTTFTDVGAVQTNHRAVQSVSAACAGPNFGKQRIETTNSEH